MRVQFAETQVALRDPGASGQFELCPAAALLPPAEPRRKCLQLHGRYRQELKTGPRWWHMHGSETEPYERMSGVVITLGSSSRAARGPRSPVIASAMPGSSKARHSAGSVRAWPACRFQSPAIWGRRAPALTDRVHQTALAHGAIDPFRMATLSHGAHRRSQFRHAETGSWGGNKRLRVASAAHSTTCRVAEHRIDMLAHAGTH
jgi:hypothetical protein